MEHDKKYFEEKLSKYGLDFLRYELCLDDIKNKMYGNVDIDWIDIINKYNLSLSKDTLRKAASQEIFGCVFVTDYLKYKNKESDLKSNKLPANYNEQIDINKDGTLTSNKLIAIPTNELNDKKALLSAHGYDPNEFELVSARNCIWQVESKSDGTKQLYSSKIIVKPRTEISTDIVKDFYVNLIKEYKPPIVQKYDSNKGEFLAELPIVDLHFGKYSTSDVVKENFNSCLARECFNYIIDSFIERFRNVKLDKVIMPIGNDFWHYDTPSATTTCGTPQDTDTSYQTLFKYGTLMLIDGITKISTTLKVPVYAFCIQGNHDFMTSYHGIMALWCYFNNNDNVTIDLGTSPRKYIQYGNCLIGFTHGNKEKKRIGTLMQVEAAEKWGKTKYREFHMAHLHSEQTIEEGGIIIRNLPSVTGTDVWHHESGYVGAIRKCSCFLWHKKYGLDSIHNFVIYDK